MSKAERDRFELKTRADWLAEIRTLCRRLNEGGHAPPWTPRTLREYVNAKFRVLVGTDALSFDELRRLPDDLKRKLEGLRAEQRAAASLSTPTARHALERNASASYEAA
jgi:hypothetical protein